MVRSGSTPSKGFTKNSRRELQVSKFFRAGERFQKAILNGIFSTLGQLQNHSLRKLIDVVVKQRFRQTCQADRLPRSFNPAEGLALTFGRKSVDAVFLQQKAFLTYLLTQAANFLPHYLNLLLLYNSEVWGGKSDKVNLD